MKSLFQIVMEAEADKKVKEDDYKDLDAPEDDDDDTGTDYTEETDSSDDGDDAPSEDEADPADDDSTDYTVDTEEVSPDDSDEDAPSDDDSTDTDSTDSDSTNETPETTPADVELSRQLVEDFSKLYRLCDSTVMKLTQVDKSNILVNQIVTRIISNINQISKHLFDYIVYQFDKGKYPYNLYRYNQFVEAFRINVEMLKKINVLTGNSQNN